MIQLTLAGPNFGGELVEISIILIRVRKILL